MLRKLTTTAALLALPLVAIANTGWDQEWEYAPEPWEIDAMDWTLDVRQDLSEEDVWELLPPPDHVDYCQVAGCTDEDRFDEFVLKLFNNNPPSNLPSYPLGCSTQCIWEQ
ncbi:MAG: hypothetical protein H6741_24205 [Alphaproteobacteria bacterium]|nr:hypothetical protein [Alphaproteobacteria bacterium]